MRSDYTLVRDIMRTCHEAHPTSLDFSALCREFPDNPARNVGYHVELLEDEGFLKVDTLHAIAGNATFQSVQWIRLSYPLAADRFLERAEGPEN